MNDNGNTEVNDVTLEKIGGIALPAVADRYFDANQQLSAAAGGAGQMISEIRDAWNELNDELQDAMSKNADNLYDAGKAVLMALGEFDDTDNVNAKSLLDKYELDGPLEQYGKKQ